MGHNGHDFSGKKNPNYKTGLTLNGGSGIYNSWQNMKQRCLNPKAQKYNRYGGRGIKVCDEWISIDGFYKWATLSGWTKGKSIDRIDNNGNYEPKNCHWVSISENSRKKKTTKISNSDAKVIRGRIKNGENVADLAREYKVVHGTIWFIANNVTHLDGDMECTKAIQRLKQLRREAA